MWTWIKQAASALAGYGKAWISKPENQKAVIDQGKKVIDGWGSKK